MLLMAMSISGSCIPAYSQSISRTVPSGSMRKLSQTGSTWERTILLDVCEGTNPSAQRAFVQPGTSVEMAVAGKPTYAEILALKAAVDSTGVRPDDTAAYVMTNAMRAVLEATPKGANAAAGMICENDRINGVPVYVTEYAPKNAVEFGYFSYALVGQFGEMDIVVDPYTKATSNSVRFVLNTDFDIKAARAEAFGILKSANASGSN